MFLAFTCGMSQASEESGINSIKFLEEEITKLQREISELKTAIVSDWNSSNLSETSTEWKNIGRTINLLDEEEKQNIIQVHIENLFEQFDTAPLAGLSATQKIKVNNIKEKINSSIVKTNTIEANRKQIARLFAKTTENNISDLIGDLRVRVNELQGKLKGLEGDMVNEWGGIKFLSGYTPPPTISQTVKLIESEKDAGKASEYVERLYAQLNAMSSDGIDGTGKAKLKKIKDQAEEWMAVNALLKSSSQKLENSFPGSSISSNEDDEESDSETEFWSYFGLGLGLTMTKSRPFIPAEGVRKEIIDANSSRIVVTEIERFSPSLLLEAHWFPDSISFSDTYGVGPFAAVQVATDGNLIQGLGIGVMIGGKSSKVDPGDVTYNIGIGYFIQNDVYILKEKYEDGDIVANTDTLFEETDIEQYLAVISFHYALAE